MNRRWKIAQAAEIRWWISYLKKKDPIDYLHKKKQYWHRVLRTLDFSLQSGSSILDAGCGPAGIFLILEDQKVVAVDPLLEAYESGVTHFERSKFPWVTFYKKPLEHFFSDQTFDVVFCLNVINHVADLETTLDNLVRLTRPGGDLLITVDTHNHPFFKAIFQTIPGDVLHPHQFSKMDYQRMFERRSCTIHKTQRLKNRFLFDYWAFWLKKE